MILVLSSSSDVHSKEVIRHLEHNGAGCFIFDPAHLPCRARVSLHLGCRGWDGLLESDAGTLALSDVRVVWDRMSAWPSRFGALGDDDARLCRTEWGHVLNSLIALLSGRPWLNARSATLHSESKLVQLDVARRVGLEIPEFSVLSNRPEDLLEAAGRYGRNLVYKSMSQHSRRVNGRLTSIRVQRIGDRATRLASRMRSAPCLLQAYVPKHLDVRVTLVGSRVFSVSINPWVDGRSILDISHAGNLPRSAYRVHPLPPGIEASLLRMCRMLNLQFAAVDLLLKPSGEYVFLEVNTQGNWLWIERHAGVPISRTVAELLMTAADESVTGGSSASRLHGNGRSVPPTRSAISIS